jgi:hypothetical protein
MKLLSLSIGPSQENLPDAAGPQYMTQRDINALANLSGAAKALLSEILKDDRSDTKGVSFMLLSGTQGF